jgi:hypothetical protein
MKALPYQSTLQVGDTIIAKSAYGRSVYKVTRVTTKFAFVNYNEHSEGKFPIIFDIFFQSLPKSQWNTIDYKVYR